MSEPLYLRGAGFIFHLETEGEMQLVNEKDEDDGSEKKESKTEDDTDSGFRDRGVPSNYHSIYHRVSPIS